MVVSELILQCIQGLVILEEKKTGINYQSKVEEDGILVIYQKNTCTGFSDIQ